MTDQLRYDTLKLHEPAARPTVPRTLMCDACTMGECGRCVRAGCFHPHDRKAVPHHGVSDLPGKGPES